MASPTVSLVPASLREAIEYFDVCSFRDLLDGIDRHATELADKSDVTISGVRKEAGQVVRQL